jgi:poly-gamma-glutamate synthesis protein (capsule biosynthesis protein)
MLGFANNHAMDYGPEAMCATHEILRDVGIDATGSGENQEGAERVIKAEEDGLTVGLLAFEATQGTHYQTMQADARRPGLNMLSVSPLYPEPHVSQFHLEKMDQIIERAADAVDALLVMVHFGALINRQITTPQRAIAKRAVEAGADTVLGAHPHILQAIDVHQGAPIFYSLGHFVFDSILEFDLEYLTEVFPPESDETAVVQLSISADGITDAIVLPAYLDTQGNPRLAENGTDQYESIANTLINLSEIEGTMIERSTDGLEVPIN